jgi:AraC family transcriptional regulator of adaptative response/methylated-DNA-[protein]-cysteine methyltransferase
MGRLKRHLREGRNVTDALYEAGFGSSSRLYERSSAGLGMTPGAYRRGGPSADIRYTIARSPLGPLLVAATARGICRVMLGDTASSLESDLRREYPEARPRREDATLRRWVEAILESVDGAQPDIELPLDIRATAFQRRVWESLRAIPIGATRSYGQIARSIGKPRAARAVGAACAANPVALVIPCHRVVREDGGLGGYAWGVGRKQALLDKEAGRNRRRGIPRAR